MNILISGGTGFVGSRVVRALKNNHKVFILTRQDLTSDDSNIQYIKYESFYDELSLKPYNIDAVINLIGENIATSRWTNEKKKRIYNSRIDATKFILNSLDQSKLKVIISASAIGYYGDVPGIEISESSPSSNDFMAKVCVDWEREALKLQDSVRTCVFRLGVVLGHDGGMMKKLLPLFKLGLGGNLGSGKQIMSFIHVDDIVKMFTTALSDESYSGIYNAVSPFPITNKKFTQELSRVLKKPAFFHASKFGIKLVLGEMSSAVLADAKVYPENLLNNKFIFKYPTIEKALQEVVSCH